MERQRPNPRKRESVLFDMILAPRPELRQPQPLPQQRDAWGTFDADAAVGSATVGAGNFFSADLSEDNFSPASYVGRQRRQQGRLYLPMQAEDVGNATFISEYEESSVATGGHHRLATSSPQRVSGPSYALETAPGEPVVHNSTALAAQALLHHKNVGSFLVWCKQDALVLSVTEPNRVKHMPVVRLGGMYALGHKKGMPPFASLGELIRFFQAHPYERGLSLRHEEAVESVF